MESFLPLLKNTSIFYQMNQEQISTLLQMLNAVVSPYKKNEIILLAGQPFKNIGVVLKGELEAHKVTSGGKQFLVSSFAPGSVFADILSSGTNRSPVSIVAKKNSKVLCFSSPLQTQIPKGLEPLFCQLLTNLATSMSQKYFTLDSRIELLLTPRLRGKIALYFLKKNIPEGEYFTLQRTHTSLAQYLGCERSALSRELSRMCKEGYLHKQGKYLTIPNIKRLSQLVEFGD